MERELHLCLSRASFKVPYIEANKGSYDYKTSSETNLHLCVGPSGYLNNSMEDVLLEEITKVNTNVSDITTFILKNTIT